MRFFIALSLMWASATAASSLNWEGHDEWMAEMPAAVEYDRAQPGAAAKRKLKPCAEPRTAYDQVPLPGRNCLAPQKDRGHQPETAK